VVRFSRIWRYFMKAYVATTGAVFALLVLAHVWRVVEEGPRLLRTPWWVLVTLAAAALCLWACRLLWTARGEGNRMR
jgi:uncharacterized membrane protein